MLLSLFDVHDWRYYYEVVVVRQGREHVLARVRSRCLAEQAMLLVLARVELSRHSLQLRRRRGVHPDRVVQMCVLLLALTLALPGLWLPAIIQLLCLATGAGLLTSGRKWRQGGEDDR